MAISLVATATATASGGPLSITVAVPIGTVDGDVMICGVNAGVATMTPPAGWTAIDGYMSGFTRYWWYRVASSEPASYAWTNASFGSGRATIATYRGVTASPIGPTSKATVQEVTGSPTSKSITLPSITPTSDGAEIVWAMVENGSGAPETWTLPAITEDYKLTGTRAVAVVRTSATNGGATGARVMTYSNVGGFSMLSGIHIALNASTATPSGLPIIAHWHQQIYGGGV